MIEIALLASRIEYAEFLKKDLDIYFKQYVKINTYCLEDLEKIDYLEEKYVIISSFTIFQKMKCKVRNHSELIIASLALSTEGIRQLAKVPKGTKALLVNLDYVLCMLVITTLYKLGVRNLELIPYWGESSIYDKEIEIAITPDEKHLVPETIKQVFNIGERIFDLNCIIEIADKLGLKKILENEQIVKALKRIAPSNLGIERMLEEKEDLTEKIGLLVNMMDQGMLVTDIAGTIYLSNRKAKKFLESRSEVLNGFNVAEIITEINIMDNVKENGKKKNDLININGNNLIVTTTPVITKGEINGCIITIDNFIDVEKRQHNLRTKIIKTSGRGHKADYNFGDIIGENEKIENVKNVAKRMAKSESSVLITGESGTGKELFAQSIHNFSSRNRYHFVAINCSALPENLLESELFGYEEGAFSGASKGGKIGLFELAHQGTLFLDEIGEMPLHLQVKLLRVIEEKKIMKIGGKDLIDIDVRIIAATNRNLLEMIKEGSFRNDFYYRLNVLTLTIPNLKQRGNDILIIASHFIDQMECGFLFSENAQDKMKSYGWPGNIRELRNVIEYLSNLGKTKVEAEDIPVVIECKVEPLARTSILNECIIDKFILQEGQNLMLHNFILRQMHQSRLKRENIGRAKLTQIALENNIFITEQEIRNGMSKLNGYGLIISGKGRKGSFITDEGVEVINKISGLLGV